MGEFADITRSEAESWLSAPRYQRYLEVVSGDDAAAIALYLWNVGLAQAVLRDVSFFEIALRNAYDRLLSEAWTGDGHWLFDDASPMRRPILRTNKRGQVTDANRINRNTIDRLREGLGEAATPDKVISNLTLGFWAHMTDRSHERDLWIPSIHRAWPQGTDRREINERIARINRVRNRAAHHERLFQVVGEGCDTEECCVSAVELLGQLAPQVALRIYGSESGESCRSSVSEFLRDHPAPCAVAV